MEQFADRLDGRLAGRTGEQAVVPDAVKPVWQDMDQEAPDELVGRQPHGLLPPLMVCRQTTAGQRVATLDPVVLPAERNGLGIGADQAVVRDCHAMGVAAEIGQHGLWAAEGWFGVDNPVRLAEWGQVGGKGAGVCQTRQIAEECQAARLVQDCQPFQKQPSEQPGQNPDRQEEPGAAADPAFAVLRQAADDVFLVQR